MLKYVVARLLDTSKNTYYFLFILTKKVVLYRSLKTLLAKNNSLISVVMSRYDLACCGMNGKSGFLNHHGMLQHEWGMPRHASLGFLTGRPHAAACSHDLPNFASFDSFLLFFACSSIFPLEHHLQDRNTHKNAQNRW